MPSKIELVYWDTCVFLAWLKNENYRPNNEMDGVYWAVEKIQKGDLRMMTAATTRGEIYESKIGLELERKFTSFLQNRFVNFVDVDYSISKLSGDLMHYYNHGSGKIPNRVMSKEDSEHLAAAIVFEADSLYTFDDGKNKGKFSLLALDGNVKGNGLKICKPPMPSLPYQISFDYQ